jgi:predicted metal-dependent hydrolase
MDELGVEIVRSPRAKRWRLEVPWGRPAKLTAPRWMTPGEIDEVVAAHAEWIANERAGHVPRLALDPSHVDEQEARTAARELVWAIADDESRALDVRFRQIRIGGQLTLWGSCSPRGTLSFNWRLVLAPFEVLDYVVVHEVCHLREPNHSRRFWALVASRRPGYRSERAWLREHGAELLAFTPRAAAA